ncbi:hypothetical protein LCGC14_0388730 [marine sediment metagenome]|uniref:Uncharacterized protein n=1 Tax=marine sediment metagenome TaxID=412755 RepID=A0A0F9VMF0_9ZZZZ
MSLNCLKDYIGVQGCTITTPDSGIFINQLPGIELEMIDSLADEQQVDFNGVWDDVQERAVRRLKTDVNAEFKKRHLLKNVTQSIDMGRIIDTSVTTVAGAQYRGVALTLRRQDEEFAYSNLQTIQVQEVSLYFSSTDATTIKVFDLQTGTELFTKAVVAPASIGFQTITIFQTFEAREIFIGYDATSLVSVELDLLKLKNAVNRTQNGCNFFSLSCGDGGNRNAELRGASATIATEITEEDLTIGDNAFGFSVKWSIVCSFDTFVCNNKEPFTRALWLLLGIELSRERKFTNRLSEFTTFDNNKAGELMKLFEVEYRGGMIDDIEYEGELFMSIDAIDLNNQDYCLECYDEVRIMEVI